jgi:hypothetical protein
MTGSPALVSWMEVCSPLLLVASTVVMFQELPSKVA